MLERVRKAWSTWHRRMDSRPHIRDRMVPPDDGGPQRKPNLFEAAAAYVTACVEDDQERIDEAVGWVEPGALVFGVNELACRALIALARERDEPPRVVARTLLGLPAA